MKKIKPLDPFMVTRYKRTFNRIESTHPLLLIFLNVGVDLVVIDTEIFYINELLREIADEYEFESLEALNEFAQEINTFYNASIACYDTLGSMDPNNEREFRAHEELINMLIKDLSYSEVEEIMMVSFVDTSDLVIAQYGLEKMMEDTQSWKALAEMMDRKEVEETLLPRELIYMFALLEVMLDQANTKELLRDAIIPFSALLASLNKMRKQIIEIEDEVSGAKVGRNDLCPCGSGKKYKKCCM
jgi:preprotein translocase subunit SecA